MADDTAWSRFLEELYRDWTESSENDSDDDPDFQEAAENYDSGRKIMLHFFSETPYILSFVIS